MTISMQFARGILLIVALGVSHSVYADFHQYHPESVVTLGKSYDSFNPGNDLTHNGYISWVNEKIVQEGGLDTTLDLSESESRERLFQLLSLDVNAEAKFALAKGTASYSRLSEVQFDERSITFVVFATKVFGSRSYGDTSVIQLSPVAKQRLEQAVKESKLVNFRRAIGSEVVTSVTRAATAAVIYNFQTSDSLKKDIIKAAIKAEWASGSVSANLISISEKIDSNINYRVHAFQIGAAINDANILDLINARPGDVATLKKVLSEAVSRSTIETAKITSFKTADISTLDDVIFSAGDEMERLKKTYDAVALRNAAQYRLFNLIERRLGTIDRILDSKKESQFVPGGRTKLLEIKKKYIELRQVISDEFGKNNTYTINQQEILNSAIDLPSFNIADYLQQPFAMLDKWSREGVRYVRCGSHPYDCEFHDFYQDWWPVLDVIHPDFIEKIRLFKNGVPVAVFRKDDIYKLISLDGDAGFKYKSQHQQMGVYTWGANVRDAKAASAASTFEAEERASAYFIEITDSEFRTHSIDISPFGKEKNALIRPLFEKDFAYRQSPSAKSRPKQPRPSK